MYAVLLVIVVVFAGGATAGPSVNAIPPVPVDVPQLVPADAKLLLSRDAELRQLNGLIESVINSVLKYFDPLFIAPFEFQYFLYDGLGVYVNTRSGKVRGLSDLYLRNLNYSDDILVLNVTLNQIITEFDAVTINIFGFGVPMKISAHGSIVLSNVKLDIVYDVENNSVTVDYHLGFTQSIMVATFELASGRPFPISDVINVILETLAQLANAQSLLHNLLNKALADFLTGLLDYLF